MRPGAGLRCACPITGFVFQAVLPAQLCAVSSCWFWPWPPFPFQVAPPIATLLILPATCSYSLTLAGSLISIAAGSVTLDPD